MTTSSRAFNLGQVHFALNNTSKQETRRKLSRVDIDAKAEEVLTHFDKNALLRQVTPLYQVVAGLREQYRIPILFEQDLGVSRSGKKVLGQFLFADRSIRIDRILPYDSPRFRWTLAHEVGHLVLHRRLDPHLISDIPNAWVDTRNELRFLRSARWGDLHWIEWQANQFAAALLLPRPILQTSLVAVQRQIGLARVGAIYLDEQPLNIRDYVTTFRELALRLSVSKSMLRFRLIHLGILTDARRASQDHIQDALRALFSEEG